MIALRGAQDKWIASAPLPLTGALPRSTYDVKFAEFISAMQN